MKILIVDQDALAAQMIRTKLESLGHEIFEEPSKDKVMDKITTDADFDVVFFDPSPLTSAKTLLLNIRRHSKHYPYLIVMSERITWKDAVQSGANDLLPKPIDPETIAEKLENAVNLTALVEHFGDTSEDFPSAGGVIAKSAFNQLFLSAMDRGERYGEHSFILQISISNYKEIFQLDGPKAADFAAATLCQHLTTLRRQSDIIGQTAKNEYSLLLQRPVHEREPFDAANRFAEQFSRFDDLDMTGQGRVEITVSLLDLPVGATLVRHVLKPGQTTN